MGKMTRAPFKPSESMPEAPGVLIISDIMGHFPIMRIGGLRYFVTYTEVFSRFCLAALLRRKSEQFTHLKPFMSAFSTQHSFQIKNIQTEGIHHRRTVMGDSQSNGIAERLNCTLTDMTLSLLSQSGLSSKCFP